MEEGGRLLPTAVAWLVLAGAIAAVLFIVLRAVAFGPAIVSPIPVSAAELAKQFVAAAKAGRQHLLHELVSEPGAALDWFAKPFG